MHHYFFDLTDDKIIRDFKGKQLRDLKQAREHALVIARNVMTTKASLLREPISDWSVTVKDGKFQNTASPLIPMQAGVSLKRQNIVEVARWRHRHPGYFWSERIDDTDSPARTFYW